MSPPLIRKAQESLSSEHSRQGHKRSSFNSNSAAEILCSLGEKMTALVTHLYSGDYNIYGILICSYLGPYLASAYMLTGADCIGQYCADICMVILLAVKGPGMRVYPPYGRGSLLSCVLLTLAF